MMLDLIIKIIITILYILGWTIAEVNLKKYPENRFPAYILIIFFGCCVFMVWLIK